MPKWRRMETTEGNQQTGERGARQKKADEDAVARAAHTEDVVRQ